MSFVSKLSKSPDDAIFKLALYVDVDTFLMPKIPLEPRIQLGLREKILNVFERRLNKLSLKCSAHCFR